MDARHANRASHLRQLGRAKATFGQPVREGGPLGLATNQANEGQILLLLPLAATSFNRAVRWLGGRQWQALHRLVYVIAPLALLHFFWMKSGKNDFAEVAVYALVIAALLLERLVRYFKPKSRASA